MYRPIPQYSNSIWRSLSPSMGTPRSSTKPRPSSRSPSIDNSTGPTVGRGEVLPGDLQETQTGVLDAGQGIQQLLPVRLL